jgi:hypothetical protein
MEEEKKHCGGKNKRSWESETSVGVIKHALFAIKKSRRFGSLSADQLLLGGNGGWGVWFFVG